LKTESQSKLTESKLNYSLSQFRQIEGDRLVKNLDRYKNPNLYQILILLLFLTAGSAESEHCAKNLFNLLSSSVEGV